MRYLLSLLIVSGFAVSCVTTHNSKVTKSKYIEGNPLLTSSRGVAQQVDDTTVEQEPESSGDLSSQVVNTDLLPLLRAGGQSVRRSLVPDQSCSIEMRPLGDNGSRTIAISIEEATRRQVFKNNILPYWLWRVPIPTMESERIRGEHPDHPNNIMHWNYSAEEGLLTSYSAMEGPWIMRMRMYVDPMLTNVTSVTFDILSGVSGKALNDMAIQSSFSCGQDI